MGSVISTTRIILLIFIIRRLGDRASKVFLHYFIVHEGDVHFFCLIAGSDIQLKLLFKLGFFELSS